MWISGPTQNFGLAMGWSLARLLIRKQDNWLISGLPYRAFNAELLAGEKLCAARALIANSNFSFLGAGINIAGINGRADIQLIDLG